MEEDGKRMENGGKLLTPLPPNYVTLASLKKRREEERLKQEEEQRKREKEEEEEKERVRKLKEEEEEVKRLKEDEIRFKEGFESRRRNPTLESPAPEEESEISIKKMNNWKEKRKERKKRMKQKKAERKLKSQLEKDADSGRSTVEEKQSPSVVVVVVVEESKETKQQGSESKESKPEGSDREVVVVDGGRRRWRNNRGRKEWRKKEESSSSSGKDFTNPVAEIAPSVGGISVVSKPNNVNRSSVSPAGYWGFRSSSNWKRGRRFGNRVREDGNLMWVKKEQVIAKSNGCGFSD